LVAGGPGGSPPLVLPLLVLVLVEVLEVDVEVLVLLVLVLVEVLVLLEVLGPAPPAPPLFPPITAELHPPARARATAEEAARKGYG
jgi:hypothetical protein